MALWLVVTKPSGMDLSVSKKKCHTKSKDIVALYVTFEHINHQPVKLKTRYMVWLIWHHEYRVASVNILQHINLFLPMGDLLAARNSTSNDIL